MSSRSPRDATYSRAFPPGAPHNLALRAPRRPPRPECSPARSPSARFRRRRELAIRDVHSEAGGERPQDHGDALALQLPEELEQRSRLSTRTHSTSTSTWWRKRPPTSGWTEGARFRLTISGRLAAPAPVYSQSWSPRGELRRGEPWTGPRCCRTPVPPGTRLARRGSPRTVRAVTRRGPVTKVELPRPTTSLTPTSSALGRSGRRRGRCGLRRARYASSCRSR